MIMPFAKFFATNGIPRTHLGRFAASDVSLCFIVLTLGLLARALSLEYMDLIDPTEARYAIVAQNMVLENDWITPKLPMPEGVVPYMGKPPLHFWLTALSFRTFGMEEWSSRLPSFISALGIIFAIFFFTRRLFGNPEAIAAALISLSSLMFFFLAGASVTDVTLSFFVTLGTIFLYRFVASPEVSTKWIYASAMSAALAFLCKGPIGIILIGLPILIFSVFRRDFAWMKRVPWIFVLVLFLMVVIPWFALNEIRNPGSLRYFFWNENIARYLFEDYGDKYGSGHIHTYGTSWLMLALTFCPWTLVLATKLLKGDRLALSALFKEEKSLVFILSWAVASPLFFTFVKQLHAMYILPSFPPLAIMTAVLLLRLPSRSLNSLRVPASNYLLPFSLILWTSLLAVGLSLELSYVALTFGCLVLLVGSLVLIVMTDLESNLAGIGKKAWISLVTYMIVIAAFTPHVNSHRSAEEILKEIIKSNNLNGINLNSVGVYSNNAFSHYWTAGAWVNELGEPVRISYLDPANASKATVDHFIAKAKTEAEIPNEFLRFFTLERESGDWLIYVRKRAHQDLRYGEVLQPQHS